MTEHTAPAQASNYLGKAETITHPPQIANLLRRIRDQKVLLSVQVPGHEGVFNSLLLDVHAERNAILFDELNPQAGHALACQTRQLQIRCLCHGVELSFACRIEVGQSQRGISFYHSPLPASMTYLQRRNDFRVPVGMSLAVPVHMPIDGAAMTDGTVTDLSMGGLGANINTHVKFTHGQIINLCSLDLPNGEQLHTEIEIRFVRQDTQHHAQHIGAAFRSIQPRSEQALRRLVTQLERDILRRKVRD